MSDKSSLLLKAKEWLRENPTEAATDTIFNIMVSAAPQLPAINDISKKHGSQNRALNRDLVRSSKAMDPKLA
jgi:hemoglobin-like flavoprotein